MCVLRASGIEFEVDRFLRKTPFTPCAVFRRGTSRSQNSSGPINKISGFNLVISNAPRDDLPAQVAEAEQFLAEHTREIRRLVRFPGLEGVGLDFAIHRRAADAAIAQFYCFPASFVRTVARLGLSLELSLYPVSGSRERSNKRVKRPRIPADLRAKNSPSVRAKVGRRR